MSRDWRQDALQQLPHLCAICGDTDDLEANYIVPRQQGGTNKLSNIQLLCRRCKKTTTTTFRRTRMTELGKDGKVVRLASWIRDGQLKPPVKRYRGRFRGRRSPATNHHPQR